MSVSEQRDWYKRKYEELRQEFVHFQMMCVGFVVFFGFVAWNAC